MQDTVAKLQKAFGVVGVSGAFGLLQAATCLRHAGVKAEDADAAASKLGSSAQDASGQGLY